MNLTNHKNIIIWCHIVWHYILSFSGFFKKLSKCVTCVLHVKYFTSVCNATQFYVSITRNNKFWDIFRKFTKFEQFRKFEFPEKVHWILLGYLLYEFSRGYLVDGLPRVQHWWLWGANSWSSGFSTDIMGPYWIKVSLNMSDTCEFSTHDHMNDISWVLPYRHYWHMSEIWKIWWESRILKNQQGEFFNTVEASFKDTINSFKMNLSNHKNIIVSCHMIWHEILSYSEFSGKMSKCVTSVLHVKYFASLQT